MAQWTKLFWKARHDSYSWYDMEANKELGRPNNPQDPTYAPNVPQAPE